MKKYAVLILLLSSCAVVNKVSEVDINENYPHDEIQKIAVIMFEAPVDEKKGTIFFSKKQGPSLPRPSGSLSGL